MTPLTIFQLMCLGWIAKVQAGNPQLVWVQPSWVMAHIRIESGFNPTVVNATGRQDGLMQVIPSTALQMGETDPQTDPETSIRTGMKYINFCGHDIGKKWNTKSIPLSALVEAYNEGQGAVEAGKRDDAYWVKWNAAWMMAAAQIAAQQLMVSRIPPGSMKVSIC